MEMEGVINKVEMEVRRIISNTRNAMGISRVTCHKRRGVWGGDSAVSWYLERTIT